jgi:DNA-binding NtrC family response regulator
MARIVSPYSPLGPGRLSPTAPSVLPSRSAVPRLQLVVEREAGKASNRSMQLEGDFFRVGSHPGNELVLQDPEVSRFHCALTRSDRGWRLTDTASLNGTYLTGVRIRDADLTADESRLSLGHSVVVVREIAPSSESSLAQTVCFGSIYGGSSVMRRLFELLKRVARTDTDVLIEGESGTGKELVAAEIVRSSARAQKPFVIVDCGSISPHLVESELFGHVKGAFTGADRTRIGAFEAADGGTVFLDEIGELPLEMQPKLLRALASREVRKLGENTSRKVDVRVVAATNRNLEREVNQGRFREDLFFRLSVVSIRLPPLRERIEDLKLLVDAFLSEHPVADIGELFDERHLAQMARYEWPGNVRELRNYVERRIVLGDMHDPAEPTQSGPPPAPDSSGAVDLDVPFRDAKDALVREFERRYLASLLAWAQGNVSEAARKAKIDRMHLHRLLQRYGLRRGGALEE